MTRLYGGVRFPVDKPCLENVRIIDHGALPMVNAMRQNGIYVDVEYLHEFAGYLKENEDRVTLGVLELTGFRVNLASKDQVADLLFRRLDIINKDANGKERAQKPRIVLKMTPTGKREVIDDEVLESLKDLHPVVALLQEFNEYNKIRTSFAETLPNFRDPQGRIHGDIKMTRVVTGRLSMTDPNLMAQPTRSELGKRIRKAFKAPKGRMLGTIDLSQIQMRVVAHAAQCENMIDIFLRNGDIHSETASKMFNLPIDKLDKMYHRYPAKRTGFGVVFMITALGLQAQLVIASDPRWDADQRQQYRDYWTEARCQDMINGWYKTNWEVGVYMNGQIARGRRTGMVWSLCGRPRLVPGIRSVHKHIRADAERECGNSPIQMGEVELVKLGMAEIWDIICDRKYDCKPLLQVHDELLFEGDDNLPEYLKEFAEVYANCAPLDVPIKSGMDTTEKSWADLDK